MSVLTMNGRISTGERQDIQLEAASSPDLEIVYIFGLLGSVPVVKV